MKILNLNAFVKIENSESITIGLAIDATFAASAWLISDEAFKNVRGRKFSWYGPNGSYYTDDKYIFERPTEEQVLNGMSDVIKSKAIELGYCEP